MLVSNIVSFAALAALLTIVPGLDTALVLRWAIARGRRQAFATAFGVNCGVWIWGAAASVGIAAILTASQLAFTALRLAGAVYLVWLGATLLPRAPAQAVEPSAPTRSISHATAATASSARWVGTSAASPRGGTSSQEPTEQTGRPSRSIRAISLSVP